MLSWEAANSGVTIHLIFFYLLQSLIPLLFQLACDILDPSNSPPRKLNSSIELQDVDHKMLVQYMNSDLIPRIVGTDLDCIVKFGRKLLTLLLLFCRNPFVLILWSKMDQKQTHSHISKSNIQSSNTTIACRESYKTVCVLWKGINQSHNTIDEKSHCWKINPKVIYTWKSLWPLHVTQQAGQDVYKKYLILPLELPT